MTELQPDALEAALKEKFALGAFRPRQAEIVRSVLSGRNTVVVMPTGAGKSLCYQLPAAMLPGVTLVVSPLIALMQDQVDQLHGRNIAATFINSSISEAERAERLRAMASGAYKLVYVAPERFRSEAFFSALAQVPLELLAIDEAHCISQWGHDFRPDYALLGKVRKRLRPPRTVALTATATPEVRDDIVRMLLMKDPQVCVAGFDRPNLFLEVAKVASEREKLDACVALAEEGSGIVYCSTRKAAESLHQQLKENDVEAVLYHAGMDDDARLKAQDAFMGSRSAVAVATNAFGMGIDKSDIRFVAHASIPKAVEAYYQEIGRAGRDGQPGRAVLLFNHSDVFTQERLIQGNYPPDGLFTDVWNFLLGHDDYERGVQALATQVGASEFEVSAVLKQLERGGVLRRGGRGEGRWGIALTAAGRDAQTRSAGATKILEWAKASAASGFVFGDLERLGVQTGLGESGVKAAFKLLEKNEWAVLRKPFAGKAISCLKREGFDSLGIDLSVVRSQERLALKLLKRMTDYAYGQRCRRAFLLRYFGESTNASSCDNCDVCIGPKLKSVAKPKATGAPREPQAVGNHSVLAAEELRRFRRDLSKDLGVPPFLIFNDATLYGLASALPTSREEFLRVKGAGDTTWERFGANVVKISQLARAAGHEPQPYAVAVAGAGRRRKR